MDDLRKLNAALEKALKAHPQDDAAAVEIIERMLAHPDAEEALYLPEVLGDLAGYYANLGRFDEAIAAMERALSAGWAGQPDGRHRIAEILLRAGRAEEAHALYAAIKADTPDDVWLYNAAGLEYAHHGDHEQALRWLTEGLELALRTGDPERLVDQLSDLRARSLAALGREPDALQEEAGRFLAQAEATRRAAEQRWQGVDPTGAMPPEWKRRALANVVFGVGWFPPAEFPAAVARWPELKESWEAATYAEYCEMLQGTLLNFAAHGMRLRLTPIHVEPFIAWCEAEGRTPAPRRPGADTRPNWCGGASPSRGRRAATTPAGVAAAASTRSAAGRPRPPRRKTGTHYKERWRDGPRLVHGQG